MEEAKSTSGNLLCHGSDQDCLKSVLASPFHSSRGSFALPCKRSRPPVGWNLRPAWAYAFVF
eukprot:1157279-Pelagomonas_calceolata.AAC.1